MTIEARVARLERHLARLGPSEATVPTYLTRNPDGSIGADFTGHVHAKGLDLDADIVVPAPGVFPPVDRTVRWLDAGGGLVAQLIGHDDTGAGVSELDMFARDRANGAVMRVGSSSQDYYTTEAILMTSLSPGGSFIRAVIGSDSRVPGAQQFTQLLDDQGRASFPQLKGGPAKRTMVFGTRNLTFPGFGDTNTPYVNVNHGLGVVPTVVLGISRSGNADVRVTAAIDNLGANTFDLYAWSVNPIASDIYSAYFLAIG